jgi:hypothetical protein
MCTSRDSSDALHDTSTFGILILHCWVSPFFSTFNSRFSLPFPSPTHPQSFNLHIGATLTIPTSTTQPLHLHRTSPQTTQQRQASLADPFDGLPLRNFAERLGEAIFPVLQAAQEQQRESLRQEKLVAQQAPSPISTTTTAVPTPQLPLLPTFLPFTRWAANSEAFKATLIIEDDPSKRKKPRLSWYHPDDTMIPRDWWKMGLLADLKYYAPFVSPSSSS